MTTEPTDRVAEPMRAWLAALRWLAVIPIVGAVLFLFVGLVWTSVVHAIVGLGLLAAAAGIWILFAEDD
jgi:succinate dehydrogenase/fumarate reductase cytochrome b subunit